MIDELKQFPHCVFFLLTTDFCHLNIKSPKVGNAEKVQHTLANAIMKSPYEDFYHAAYVDCPCSPKIPKLHYVVI